MKKFMFYLMAANTIVSSIVMIVVLAMGGSSLPAVVLALRGLLIVGGLTLIVKRYASWVRRWELSALYAAEAVAAVFNLVYLSVFYPVSVPLYEFFITGTLVTPFLNAILVLLLYKLNNRYAVLENPGEPDTAHLQVRREMVKQN